MIRHVTLKINIHYKTTNRNNFLLKVLIAVQAFTNLGVGVQWQISF